jgi:hypothetical protein
LVVELAAEAQPVTRVWGLAVVLVVFFQQVLLPQKVLTQCLSVAVAQVHLAQMELEQTEDLQQLLV